MADSEKVVRKVARARLDLARELEQRAALEAELARLRAGETASRSRLRQQDEHISMLYETLQEFTARQVASHRAPAQPATEQRTLGVRERAIAVSPKHLPPLLSQTCAMNS